MFRDFYCDKLRVRVFGTRQEMGSCAGAEAAEVLKKLLGERESVNVMFAAAPSQNETLAALLEDPAIDWSRVNAFHMDEYVGLDPEHPAGFRNYLHRAIFGRKPFKSIHLINGNAPDPVREASGMMPSFGSIPWIFAFWVWERMDTLLSTILPWQISGINPL